MFSMFNLAFMMFKLAFIVYCVFKDLVWHETRIVLFKTGQFPEIHTFNLGNVI